MEHSNNDLNSLLDTYAMQGQSSSTHNTHYNHQDHDNSGSHPNYHSNAQDND